MSLSVLIVEGPWQDPAVRTLLEEIGNIPAGSLVIVSLPGESPDLPTIEPGALANVLAIPKIDKPKRPIEGNPWPAERRTKLKGYQR